MSRFASVTVINLMLALALLGAPSTKMAYATEGDGEFIRTEGDGGSPRTQYMAVLAAFDATGYPRGFASYKQAGPFDSAAECNAFVHSGDAALTDAAGDLLDQSGDDIVSVGVKCVPVQ